ncbi:MAG: barstar family protein [Peptococcaceae bacterium]|nr:barstar family protein [Peptococcaceae bacterium]MBO5428365.1 barstar family protein [Peptococcaceae bacterium]
MSDIAVLNLDGTVLTSKEELHNTIFYQLALPDYYGRNLDALWDVLSTWSAPLRIEVTHTELLKMHLADYADALLELLRDAAAENNTVTLIIS